MPFTGYNGIEILQIFYNLLSGENDSNFIYVVEAKYAMKFY
jgi:hypothetical protein